MYDKLAVLCPTYKRHDTKLPKFIETAIETADNVDNIIFCFVINANDQESRTCIRRMCKKARYEIVEEHTDKPNLSLYYNLAFDHMGKVAPNALVSMFGDDMEFITSSWDKIFIDQMNRMCGFGIVTGDDDYCQHGDKPVYFVTSRWFVNLTGGVFMPENVKVDLLDDIWRDIALKLKCYEYLPNLHILHNHATRTDTEDVTWIRNRKAFFEQGSFGEFVVKYPSKLSDNVLEKMAETLPENVAFMMTCHNRLPLLKDTIDSWNASVLLPNKITVFDDHSSEFKSVMQFVKDMRGAKLIRAPEHRGCDKNNVLSIMDEIKDESIEWVSVIDSDTKFSKYWLIKFLELYSVASSEKKCAGFTLFNAKEHKVECEINGYKSKGSVGGFGTTYKASHVREALKDYDFTKLIPSWDNKVNDYVKDNEMFFLCSERSFLQHAGYFEGTHVGDLADSDYATDFIGDDIMEEKLKDPVTGNILVAAMARLGDVVAASCIVNMIIDEGISVTWLTIPKHENLIRHICNRAEVITVEPMVGGPNGDWSEINRVAMKEKFPVGYNAYLNLQIGSREHHNRYLNSGMHPLDYLRLHAQNTLGVDLPDDYLAHFSFNAHGVEITREMHSLNDKLVVISPKAITSNAMSEELVEQLAGIYRGKGYEVRRLVEKRPDKTSIFDIRKNYIIKHNTEQCIWILRRASVFIGNDSGMAWCSLFGNSKRIIYHVKDRIKITNTKFSRIDPDNSEDIIMDTGTISTPQLDSLIPTLTVNKARNVVSTNKHTQRPPVQHGPRGKDSPGGFTPPPIPSVQYKPPVGKKVITFSRGGRMGNMICQYIVARLFADLKGYHLGTPFEYPGVINKYMPKANETYGPSTATIIKETIETGNILEAHYPNGHYHLEGFWQEAEYYNTHRDKILCYFDHKAPPKTITKDIIMHVRLGDYKEFGVGGNVLDPEYYHKCLKREKFKKLYIVTDSPDDSYFSEFKKYSPIVQSKTVEEDFWFITKFDRIICANSTFSWWAAFVSNATKIYIPKCWIRNSNDIKHDMFGLNNGKCIATTIPAGFKEY